MKFGPCLKEQVDICSLNMEQLYLIEIPTQLIPQHGRHPVVYLYTCSLNLSTVLQVNAIRTKKTCKHELQHCNRSTGVFIYCIFPEAQDLILLLRVSLHKQRQYVLKILKPYQLSVHANQNYKLLTPLMMSLKGAFKETCTKFLDP